MTNSNKHININNLTPVKKVLFWCLFVHGSTRCVFKHQAHKHKNTKTPLNKFVLVPICTMKYKM